MRQPTQRLAERRTPGRESGSFTFWFRRPNSGRHIGAWMLNHNESGAAFLTAARDAPRVGEKLELTELRQFSLANPEPVPPSAARIPQFGRVVRLDDAEGVIQRVAIRFERMQRRPL
jgi:hypothetical protein